MNAIMNEKSNRSKLLVAVAVLALVVCAFSAIIPANEVQGATTQVAAPEGEDTLQAAIDAAQSGDVLVLEEGTYTPTNGYYTIEKNITIKAGQTVQLKDLMLESGTYYISMQSTNASKGGNADYSVRIVVPNLAVTSVGGNVSGTGILTASCEGEALSVGDVEPITVTVTDRTATAYGA